MTYVRFGSGSSFSMEDVMIFLVVIVILAAVVWGAVYLMRVKDDSKPLQTANVKILEKPLRKGNTEWYVVEFENGERKSMRSFRATKLLITVGDEGILGYKGITIQSFQPASTKKE